MLSNLQLNASDAAIVRRLGADTSNLADLYQDVGYSPASDVVTLASNNALLSEPYSAGLALDLGGRWFTRYAKLERHPAKICIPIVSLCIRSIWLHGPPRDRFTPLQGLLLRLFDQRIHQLSFHF